MTGAGLQRLFAMLGVVPRRQNHAVIQTRGVQISGPILTMCTGMTPTVFTSCVLPYVAESPELFGLGWTPDASPIPTACYEGVFSFPILDLSLDGYGDDVLANSEGLLAQSMEHLIYLFLDYVADLLPDMITAAFRAGRLPSLRALHVRCLFGMWDPAADPDVQAGLEDFKTVCREQDVSFSLRNDDGELVYRGDRPSL